MTNGEYLVGVSFNPSANPSVDEVKKLTAALIDLVEKVGRDGRTTALAVTNFEQAAMWAVKSITKTH